MDNILFIGNGFDLHNGLKTKYTDYLDNINNTTQEKVEIKNKLDELIYELDKIRIEKIDRVENFVYVEAIGYSDITFKEYIAKSGDIKLNNKILEVFENPIWMQENLEAKRRVIEFRALDFESKIAFLIILLNILLKKINIDKDYAKINDLENSDIENYEVCFYVNHARFLNSINTLKDENKILTNYSFEELVLIYNIDFEIDNVFETYLQLLRQSKFNNKYSMLEVKAGENWIDVENILYENQYSHFRSKLRTLNDSRDGQIHHWDKRNLEEFNELKYKHFVEKFGKGKSIVEDFNYFKMKFAKYIKEVQKEADTKSIYDFYDRLYTRIPVNKIYNFNYSNYLNNIIKAWYENEYEKQEVTKPNIRNIHGDISNGADIVFGTNHYMFLNDLKQHNQYLINCGMNEYLREEEEEFKLTKMYQLMKISDSNRSHKLNKVSLY